MNVKNDVKNVIEESSSNNYSSIEENIIYNNSEIINSLDYPEKLNLNKEHKKELVDFSFGSDSLNLYYDSFYS